MTWVKVCGLKKQAEVRAAEQAGADAFGLVLVPGSPRKIAPERAAILAQQSDLPAFLLTVDASPSELLDLASYIGVHGVQPYGTNIEGSVDAALRAGFEVLLPVRVDAEPVDLMDSRPDVTPLVDASEPGRLGGTGRRFDADLLDPAGREWVMAGGLTPDNVADAIRESKPWGVDASSGLESSEGIKDIELITRFVEEAKRA